MDNNRKIKILELCAVDMTIKSLLLPLINKLIKEGYDVTSCASLGNYSSELREKGYKVVNIGIDRKISMLSNIKSIVKLYKLMKQERFDIVHVHTPVAALLGRVAAKLAGVPIIIYTAHGFYFHERMPKVKYNLYLFIERIAGRMFTDFIFTQSEEDRITSVKNGIIKEDKIITIGNGVDIYNRFNPERINKERALEKAAELGISEGDVVITFVGRLVREKGIIELLTAFEGIEAKNCKLLLIGGLDSSERDMATYSIIKDITEKDKGIIMAGSRYDIEDMLFISDIFVLPSYREGMPRSIIEAMAMEKPVVATNIRGCREEVLDCETGFITEVGDYSDLRIKLLRLIENSSLRYDMGRKGRKRAEDYYDENVVIWKQLNTIKKLMDEKYRQ